MRAQEQGIQALGQTWFVFPLLYSRCDLRQVIQPL